MYAHVRLHTIRLWPIVDRVSIEADAARAAAPNPQRTQETHPLQEALSKILTYFFLNYCDAGINSDIAFASMERSPNLLPLL